MKPIRIYCDGACSGNPGPGGWGALLCYGEHIKEISGGEKEATNQRMELMACLQALRHINRKNIPVEIYSDSAYLTNCFQQGWYKRWLRNGWYNSKKEAVKNKDLWEPLVHIVRSFDHLQFIKVKGHSGDEMNDRADQLAVEARQKVEDK